MRPKIQFMFRCIIALSVFALLFVFAGCEDDNPVDPETELQEADLFPISVGHLWVFSAYDINSNGQQVPGTSHRDVSYVQGTTTIGGKTALRLIDSTYSPGGQFESIDTTYLAIENGNLLFYGEEETGGTWITFFDRSAGFNTEFTGGQFQQVEGGVTATITFKGKISPKESISIPIGTVEAYKAELKIILTFGTETFEWAFQDLYFADGYGPVKMSFPSVMMPGSNEPTQGEETVLVSKNF